MNCLSKKMILESYKNMTAEWVTQTFVQHFYWAHELFTTIVSDWGTQFMSSLWKRVCQLLKIVWRMFTAYHLKTDRATEQMNQNVELYICTFSNYSQNNWASLLFMTLSQQKWASSFCLMSITWSLYNYLRSWSSYGLQKVQYRKLIKSYKRWKKSQSEHRWLWLSLNRYRKKWWIRRDSSHTTSRKKTRSD